jgi:hypothetical protein
MRDGLGIDSHRMGPGRPTKVLGKRSVPVELDCDWDKPVASYHAISTNKQTNKQTNSAHISPFSDYLLLYYSIKR